VLANRAHSLQVIWSAPSVDFTRVDQPVIFTQQDQQEILDAVQATEPGGFSLAKLTTVQPEIVIVSARRQGDWALFSTEQRAGSDATPLQVDPGLFGGHKVGTTWSLFAPGEPDFCDEFRQMPTPLLDAIDLNYYC
jgi:hypothetical protein